MSARPDIHAVKEVVQCVVLLRLHHLGDRVFDYLVPPGLRAEVEVGSLVSVPFRGRPARAVVVGLGPSEETRGELKTILAVLPGRVPADLLELARSLTAHYLCSFESCLRLMVPPPGGRRRADRVDRSIGAVPVRREWVKLSDCVPQGLKLTSKQQKVLESIPPEGIATAPLLAKTGVGKAVLAGLAKKGLIEWGPAPLQETVFEPQEPPELWPEQAAAVSLLTAALEEGRYSRRLLWGVTGSGKTEVYLRLLRHTLERGGGAILLVPEIALTPQTVERVRARFGSQVAVFHSGLPPGQRLREYRRIQEGEARIVVGARSAVFAPVADLRLVIIDEAHDSSYKQEEEPRYEARKVAELRLRAKGGLLVEGSATPAVESLGEDVVPIRLSRRAVGALPEVEVVDMRLQGAGLLLAPRAREALAEVLRRGEQAIILLNRRGSAGYVHCEQCGHVLSCAACELAVTYHGEEQRLVCHHCGRSFPQPPLCPRCHEATLTRSAPGTERLDRELRRFVPQQRVFRMDSDVATTAAQIRRILSTFAASRPGVLVGTQMVAKGHDFPYVTLVLVADADVGLYVPDFRAAERTFQLLMQVAGRAGRAERPGRVLVQTWNPEVPCIRMALQRDEAGFYRQELETRRRLGYPPFAELIRLVTVSPEAEKARAGAYFLAERLSRHFRKGELRGPARLLTLRGKERWHLVIATPDGARARAIVRQADAQLSEPYRERGVTLIVDVDPQSFT